VLIEALGQQFDTSKVESPLLQLLLSSNMISAHPAGGIGVDFVNTAD
jgi:hypothetical protein